MPITMEQKDSETVETHRVISQATPVQIGIVLILLGGFASWIWWAATISSKLDVLVARQSSVESGMIKIEGRMQVIEAWRSVIDNSGSPSLTKLREALDQMDRKVSIYMESHK